MNALPKRTSPTAEQAAKLRSTRRLEATDSADVPALIISGDHHGDRIWLLNDTAQVAPGVVEYVLAHRDGHLSIVYRSPVGRLFQVGVDHGVGGAVTCRYRRPDFADRPCCRRLDWVDALTAVTDAERMPANPHYHCATLDTAPCPTGEHVNPAVSR